VKTICALIGACLLASAIVVLALAATVPPQAGRSRAGADVSVQSGRKVVLQAAGGSRLARVNPANSR